uniref:Uncharacterized protein n=1 Tax=Avena sativa TaxID=4498 RepID=A0ACD5Y9L5_AVESA
MAQWWNDWELRILVLASLIAQYFLVLLASVRKFYIPSWLRFLYRLAHMGSDALAIFAIATLFSRQKNGPSCSYTPGSRDLELLSAPILLMHLGGQVVITSYKIEDNEGWTRYIKTSLSKVAIALYVFYKTWSSNDKKLLAATVLLFIVVLIRCFHKALTLKGTSFNALREANLCEVNIDHQIEQLLHFIEQAKQFMDRAVTPRTQGIPILPCQLFLDFPCSYSDRLVMLKYFWWLRRESAYGAIEGALSNMTNILYTKDLIRTRYLKISFKNDSAPIFFRHLTQDLICGTLLIVIYLAFGMPQEVAKGSTDSVLTECLFVLTVILEFIYMSRCMFSRETFSGRILQHNLIRLFAHNRRHSTLRSIAGWLQCKDLLDGFWSMVPINSCKEITELVLLHVETGWKEYIRDPYSYRMFNDTRGEWTLARNRCLQQLGWSTRMPLDESVILWHLATDFCIHHRDHTSPDDIASARRCTEMSNYMVHLLSDNPEMLTPGSRKWLLATVCNKELERSYSRKRGLRGTKKSLLGEYLRNANRQQV